MKQKFFFESVETSHADSSCCVNIFVFRDSHATKPIWVYALAHAVDYLVTRIVTHTVTLGINHTSPKILFDFDEISKILIHDILVCRFFGFLGN